MFDVNNFLYFQVHGAGAHDHNGLSKSVEGLLTFFERLATMQPAEIFSAIFPGISSLVNIHPMLVHFPIAFFVAFMLFDLLGTLFKKANWRNVAGYLLYMGTLTAVMTVIAGFMAANSVPHDGYVHAIMERHKQLGLSILSLSIALSAWRLKSQSSALSGKMNVLYVCLSVVLVVLVSLAADLGGLMVYKYGVAVEAVPTVTHTHTHHHH